MIESKVAPVILEFEFESPGHLVEVQILLFLKCKFWLSRSAGIGVRAGTEILIAFFLGVEDLECKTSS